MMDNICGPDSSPKSVGGRLMGEAIWARARSTSMACSAHDWQGGISLQAAATAAGSDPCKPGHPTPAGAGRGPEG